MAIDAIHPGSFLINGTNYPLNRFSIHFELEKPLGRARIYPGSLHAIFRYTVRRFDPVAAAWLEQVQRAGAPRPYALVHRRDSGRRSCRFDLHVNTYTADAFSRLYVPWRRAVEAAHTVAPRLDLKCESCTARVLGISHEASRTYGSLLPDTPRVSRTVRLEFVTPTAFRQGRKTRLVPDADKVFRRPAAIWAHCAPAEAPRPPDDWLAWCVANVEPNEFDAFRTVQRDIGPNRPFRGFIGRVGFQMRYGRGNDTAYAHHERFLHAFGALAAFTGVGCRTALGYGGVTLA